MELLLEKLKRIVEDLNDLRYEKSIKVSSYEIAYGKVLDDATEWMPYETGDIWAKKAGTYCWFKTSIHVPDHMAGQKVVFHISTGHKAGWDISNPQFIIWVNGQLVQGLDVNHRSTVLSDDAKPGDSYEILLQGYSNLLDESVVLYSDFSVLKPLINDFYYNLSNAFDAMRVRFEEDYHKVVLGRILDAITWEVDFRDTSSPAFLASIELANKQLKEALYKVEAEEGPLVSLVGHSHIDVAWLWTKDQTRQKVIRSFSTVLYLMKRYPEYRFMSSQPQLYAYLKEEAPDLYDQVKERVMEGRWEVDGGMWVESDCNIPSGESLVRQVLYGTRFIREEFGQECETLWLPDAFGFSGALPQIMKKSGLPYFMTSKMDWNQFNKLPHDTFLWEGIDGTRVLAHMITASDSVNLEKGYLATKKTNPGTTYNGRVNANQVQGTWLRYKDKTLTDETLQLFGFGDGGGGPTEEMLENHRRLSYGLPGLPRTEMSFQKDYFRRLEEKVISNRRLGKWRGELYFENHRGTLTSLAKNKRYNRILEFLYQDLEFISLWAGQYGYAYPKNLLEECWKTILTNQFHDIITGTSIKEVYDETDRMYEEVMAKGQDCLRDGMSYLLNSIESESSLLVVNTLSHSRTDLVELDIDKLRFEKDQTPCEVMDDRGHVYPLYDTYEPGKCIFLAKDIPGKGFRTYSLVSGQREEFKSSGKKFNGSLSNSFYDISFNDAMEILSIYDKEAGREIVKEGGRANVLQIFEDRPSDFDNWNIDYQFKDKIYEIDGLQSAEIIETNPLRTVISIRRTYGHSTIDQKIILHNHHKRIDFKTHVDWHEQHVLLKAAFELGINSEDALYDMQYGYVSRKTHENESWSKAQFEVCGHKWADLSEGNYGVSLMNDCKYGYDIKDSLMRLTLIKCGTYPYEEADQGAHDFTYSLYGHQGSLGESDCIPLAYELNVPIRSHIEMFNPLSDNILHQPEISTHENKPIFEGINHGEPYFVTCNAKHIIIDTVKESEDGQGIILRLFETMNYRSKVSLSFNFSVNRVWTCNLLEVKEDQVDIVDHGHDQTIDLMMNPFEIKTLFIT